MKRFLFLLVFVSAASVAHAQGVVQLSTYYPSPFGKYDRIQLVPRTTLAAPCDPGTMYINSGAGNQLEVCNAAGNAFAPLSGGPWTEDINGVYVTDTTANVGIGTTTPTSRLHVVAAEGMTPPGVFLEGADINVDGGPDGQFMIRNNSASGTQKIFLTGTSGATPVLTVDGVAQNVGIGTTTPRTKLELGDDGAILAAGTLVAGWTEPNIGVGTRLLWYPRKAAFRAGYANGSQWDNAQIGIYSVAMGFSSISSSSASTAMGNLTTASGSTSTAMGSGTVASGGSASTALGNLTTASGSTSTAMGSGTVASGIASTSMGSSTTANGSASTAIGFSTTATGNYSTAMGAFTTAQAYASTVLGRYNVISGDTTSWVATDPLFVIGNGTNAIARANALTVLKNGNVGIGADAPQNKLDVEGGVAVGTAYSGANTAPANGMIVEGSVGIGTNAPAEELHIGQTLGNVAIQVGNLGVDDWQLIRSVGDAGITAGAFAIKRTGAAAPALTIGPTDDTEVAGKLRATGGLIIETRTTNPVPPLPGQMWLCTDVAPYCDGS